MPHQIITTANAPSSPLYSQGVKAGPLLVVSGIVGIDPSTGKLAGDTIQAQTRQALTNCNAILEAAVPNSTTSSRWASCSPTPPTSPP
jgi:enamine deaminase RidA (YjgF/YER057c/UK114 family)